MLNLSHIPCGGAWTIFNLMTRALLDNFDIDDKSSTITLPRTVCDELLGPMVFNTVDSRARELGGNP